MLGRARHSILTPRGGFCFSWRFNTLSLHADARARPPATRLPATPHRTHARPPAPGGHVVALLPPSVLCLSGLGGLGQSPCQRASQRWTLAPVALHRL